MKTFLTFILAFVLFTHSAFAADPTKGELLFHWEQAQKNDPNTKVFEKTSKSGVYRLKTEFFPYDGRVRVLNLFIDRYDYGGTGEQISTGMVEVELMDAKPEFIGKYAYSYQAWQENNRFFFDHKTG